MIDGNLDKRHDGAGMKKIMPELTTKGHGLSEEELAKATEHVMREAGIRDHETLEATDAKPGK